MMKLMTLKQYMKMSKPALIRKITKTLRAMPKKRLAVLCYNITKSKLPRLRKRMLEAEIYAKKEHPALHAEIERYERKTRRTKKRKFSRKQLAAQRLFAKRAKAGKLQQIRSLKRAGF